MSDFTSADKIQKIIYLSQIEYLKSYPSRFQQIMPIFFTCCLNKDAESKDELLRFFHSIKGTSATLSFIKLSEIGKEYEDYLKNTSALTPEHFQKIAIGIALIQKEFESLLDKFKNFNEKVSLDDLGSSNTKKRAKILVADDDLTILHFMQNVLDQHDFDVYLTPNPSNIISMINEYNIDVVILDIIIFDKNGFMIYNEIKERKIDVKVIFITGVDVIDESLSISNDIYLKKPIDVNDLIQKLDSILTVSPLPSIENTTDIEYEFNSSTSAKKSILLIDDDPVILNLLTNILSEKYDIIIANDGESGIESFNKYSPDLLIVDLMLPKVDGFEVARRIKGISKNTRIIILSARKREDDIIRCFETGVDDYISKPFNIHELEIRIRRLIE